MQQKQQQQQRMKNDTRMEMTVRAICHPRIVSRIDCHPSQPLPMQRYKKKSPPFFASTVVVMGDVVVGKGDAVESRNGRTKRLKIWTIVSSILFLCSHLEDVESMNCLCSPTSHIYEAHKWKVNLGSEMGFLSQRTQAWSYQVRFPK